MSVFGVTKTFPTYCLFSLKLTNQTSLKLLHSFVSELSLKLTNQKAVFWNLVLYTQAVMLLMQKREEVF